MIPLFRPSCSELEIEYVTEVLRSGWWGMGPKTEELEEKFARFVGTSYAVATNSATAALMLAMDAMDLGGNRVIVPALTFVSDALAAVHNGYDVIFADVKENTLTIDWDDVWRKAASNDIVVPVWYGGAVTTVPQWAVNVLEDCSHAAGSYDAGLQGRAAVWSFHAVKNIAAGDGGMITTNDADMAKRLRALRWCGIDRSTWDRDKNKPYGWDYNVIAPGHKAHMNDITAALALAQLERIHELNGSRHRLVQNYLRELDGIEWLRLPYWDSYSSWHLFYVRVAAEERDRFIDHMLLNGISAGVHYKSLNNYSIFGKRQDLPVTDQVWKTLVTLPLYPDLSEADQQKVITAVKSFR